MTRRTITVAEALRHEYGVYIECNACRRWRWASREELARMAAGRLQLQLGKMELRLRCDACGRRGAFIQMANRAATRGPGH
jgi:hypothetical protein